MNMKKEISRERRNATRILRMDKKNIAKENGIKCLKRREKR